MSCSTAAPGADSFVINRATLAASTVTGGGGNDTLSLITDSGTIVIAGVSGVETIDLASAGSNILTLLDANFVGVTGGRITVDGGGKGNTIDASGVSAGNSVVLNGGTGADTFIMNAATLATATVAGGGGSNTLSLIDSGTIVIARVGGVEMFTLASVGSNA